MRRGQAIRLSAFATGSALTEIGVYGSDAGFGYGHGRTSKEDHCTAKRGVETHKHSTNLPIVPSDARSDRTRTCGLTAKVGLFLEIEVPRPDNKWVDFLLLKIERRVTAGRATAYDRHIGRQYLREGALLVLVR